MLYHFFDEEVGGKPTKQLFNNLKLSEDSSLQERYQGKNPVILLTFKGIQSYYRRCLCALRRGYC